MSGKSSMNIKFSPWCSLFPAVLIIGGYSKMLVPLILSVLVHEAGHYFTVRYFHGEISSLSFNAGGLKLEYNSSKFSYIQDIVCSLSGPAAGLFSSIIASILNFELFCGISIVISAFNLIPVRPLDGGKILYSMTSLIFDEKSHIICRFIEITVLIILSALAVYVFIFTSGNISLLLITCVLIFYYCKEL